MRLGPSPRGLQALCLAGRVAALLDGRPALAFRDIRDAAHGALRHRLVLSFDALREGISPESVIDAAIAVVKESAD